MMTLLDQAIDKALGQEAPCFLTERVDDIVLLIGQMVQMGLPEILDRHIPHRGPQRTLSWGWTAVIWLAYILSEQDHRKVSMERFVAGMITTLSEVSGQPVTALDFSDDRLTHLLRHLSKSKVWERIERELSERSIDVYELPTDVIRCDPTTVSGYHAVTDEGIMQFGHSKDDPSLPQFKLSMASLDPMGMPLACEVVSGENADDGLYLGLIERVTTTLKKTGLLIVGDCKLSALTNRQQITASGQYYLTPLPATGTRAQAMSDWIDQGLARDREGRMTLIFRDNDRGETLLAGSAYEFERTQPAGSADPDAVFQERILVVYSPAHAQRQSSGLEKRLENAQQAIEALTPPRGRGKRQIVEESRLTGAIARILAEHRVQGLLDVTYERQCHSHTRYVGRGRGSPDRERRRVDSMRYQITAVTPNEAAIATAKQRFGWKAFATNASHARLSLTDAVLCYRNEYRVERIFHRLKSRLDIAPLFVKRDDQIIGLTHLLTLGVRVLTLMEFVVRRALQADQVQLPGLYPENPKKRTDKPTAERILKAFSGITLTRIQDATGKTLLQWLTPLSTTQQAILYRLGLNGLYARIQNSG